MWIRKVFKLVKRVSINWKWIYCEWESCNKMIDFKTKISSCHSLIKPLQVVYTNKDLIETWVPACITNLLCQPYPTVLTLSSELFFEFFDMPCSSGPQGHPTCCFFCLENNYFSPLIQFLLIFQNSEGSVLWEFFWITCSRWRCRWGRCHHLENI